MRRDRAGRRRRRRDRLSRPGRSAGRCATGQQAPVLWVTLGAGDRAAARRSGAVGLSGRRSNIPEAGRFNIRGGMEMLPEFVALLFGLVIYTGGLHRRGGARRHPGGVARARPRRPIRSACGRGRRLRLVVIPQAMRVIIPPLTSQYLNLTKNSTLAVAIGYPDLVQIFTGTVLNQTGQAVEVDRHHHGGLSHHQPRHLGADESLQPPHGAGGAVSDGAHHDRRRS